MRFKDGREIRQINPSQTSVNLQYLPIMDIIPPTPQSISVMATLPPPRAAPFGEINIPEPATGQSNPTLMLVNNNCMQRNGALMLWDNDRMPLDGK